MHLLDDAVLHCACKIIHSIKCLILQRGIAIERIDAVKLGIHINVKSGILRITLLANPPHAVVIQRIAVGLSTNRPLDQLRLVQPRQPNDVQRLRDDFARRIRKTGAAVGVELFLPAFQQFRRRVERIGESVARPSKVVLLAELIVKGRTATDVMRMVDVDLEFNRRSPGACCLLGQNRVVEPKLRFAGGILRSEGQRQTPSLQVRHRHRGRGHHRPGRDGFDLKVQLGQQRVGERIEILRSSPIWRVCSHDAAREKILTTTRQQKRLLSPATQQTRCIGAVMILIEITEQCGGAVREIRA